MPYDRSEETVEREDRTIMSRIYSDQNEQLGSLCSIEANAKLSYPVP